MTKPMKPRTPSGLSARPAKFWRDVVGMYDLRLDELVILEAACREMHVIDRIQDELDDLRVLHSTGSMGQKVADPMVSELRQHNGALKALLVSLKLPDPPAEAGNSATSASSAAIAMNRARWQKPARASGT